MARSRTFVHAVVGCILAVTLVSGPLVPAMDFTQAAPERGAIGEGNATVEVLSAPDRAELARGSYGSGSYYLTVPDATVRLAGVTGKPMLVYELRLPERGYSRGTTHFLSAAQTGTYAVSLERDSWLPEEVEQDSYEGELVILLRNGNGDRTVYRGNVTVAVER